MATNICINTGGYTRIFTVLSHFIKIREWQNSFQMRAFYVPPWNKANKDISKQVLAKKCNIKHLSHFIQPDMTFYAPEIFNSTFELEAAKSSRILQPFWEFLIQDREDLLRSPLFVPLFPLVYYHIVTLLWTVFDVFCSELPWVQKYRQDYINAATRLWVILEKLEYYPLIFAVIFRVIVEVI